MGDTEVIDSFLLDENKVITYKWLSQTLSVHVNKAKQILHAYVQKQRNDNENDTINVCYLVSGLDHQGIYKVVITPEENLSAIKAKLKSISGCHLYSIQKSKCRDSNALYMTDYEAFRQNTFECNAHSAIKYEAAKPRTEEQVEEIRQSASQLSVANTQSNVSKSKPTTNKGIAGMFASASKPKSKSETTSLQSAADNSKGKGDGKSIAKGSKAGTTSFFAKAKIKHEQPKDDQNIQEQPKVEDKVNGKKPSGNKKKPTKKNKKTASDDEDKPAKKKRKRIQSKSDSSSDDEMQIDESPVPSPRERSPEVSPVKERSASPQPPIESTQLTGNLNTSPQRQRRKQVTKISRGEDDFMVTEKVWVWETDSSDASQPVEPKPEVNKPVSNGNEVKKTHGKKPIPTKTGNKQASLMNFFKKK